MKPPNSLTTYPHFSLTKPSISLICHPSPYQINHESLFFNECWFGTVMVTVAAGADAREGVEAGGGPGLQQGAHPDGPRPPRPYTHQGHPLTRHHRGSVST
jgi:hypothetical protein